MTTEITPEDALTGERAELLEALRTHRGFLRKTVEGLTDEQAASTPTASELCLGGLIKHVARTERTWIAFVKQGPSVMSFGEDFDWEARANEFRMLPGETLTALLAEYDAIAEETDALARIGDLDADQPLPEAPWYAPGARWSLRRVLVHIVAETAQHAGHADIIRETIDGAKTMG